MVSVCTSGLDRGALLVVEPTLETDRVAFQFIGAAIAVHRALGPGYIESIYERALCVELELRDIPFERQVLQPIFYRGHVVGQHRMDLIIDRRVIVELKAVHSIETVHVVQTGVLGGSDLETDLGARSE